MTNPTAAEVIAFLNGEAALDGRWFGDLFPSRLRGNFWWRKYLPLLAPSTDAGDMREKVARIIDERAWRQRQAYLDGISDEKWRTGHPNEGIAQSMRVSGARLAGEVVAPSLAKADAILALLPSYRQGLEDAAKKLDEMHVEWNEQAKRYREAGNFGPYLGAPSYANGSRAIRVLGAG